LQPAWSAGGRPLPSPFIQILTDSETQFTDSTSIEVPLANHPTIGGITMSVAMKFLKDDSGATAIEYGLIAAGISVAIIAVVQGVGSKLNSTFTSVQNALN
jgi:pilus assembly protein Flp/PilA